MKKSIHSFKVENTDGQKMKFLTLILIFAGVVGVADGQVVEKLTISLHMEDGNMPKITGIVKNAKMQSVEGAHVQISTSFGTVEAITDNNGEFVYELPNIPSENKFTISVKADKEGYQTSYANTSFFVNNSVQDDKSNEYGFKVVTTNKLREDPTALKIIENIEQSKQKEAQMQKKLKEIEERQKLLAEQREIANVALLNDLQAWIDQFDPFKPRNVFATFVSQIDATVQDIYWGQFNFTEAKTKEGLVAMQQVLDNNGTAHDARKAFYEKAAIKQSDMHKVNDELNIKYGKNHTDPVD